MARAQRRNREHLKRVTISDITHKQELEMRRKTRKCPMCHVWMTSKPHLPNSKELDHILPVNQGGTHTHGNVRIICRKCNQARPKDGSDYTGTLSLWAQDGMGRPHGGRGDIRGTCRKGLHPWVPENITTTNGKQRCAPCARERWRKRATLHECPCGAQFAASGATFMCPACIDVIAHRAAELHATGLSWRQVASLVGYTTAEGVRGAALRIGYRAPSRPERPPRPQRRCGCGQPVKGPGKRHCDACIQARAQRALQLHHQGEPHWTIARELGYTSITSVANLLKSVMTDYKPPRMGRPPRHSVTVQ